MKRICIFCDGTWNRPDKTEADVPIATNVVRVAEAVAPSHQGTAQAVYYDPGIGSSGSWLKRLYDGATGHGISQNIKEAYRYLVRTFEPGDELFFFGFSRGAFTVRSLAGMVRCCGILQPDTLDVLDRAFKLYRSRSPATAPRARETSLFRRAYAVEERTPIAFIGVWDTVGALGNPLYFGRLSPGNRFHDTDLSSSVAAAYQALAIDERRRNFRPAIWNRQDHSEGQILEQVWFVGAHSNVGGGYPDTGLSDHALAWLAEKAAGHGLGIGPLQPQPNVMVGPANSRKGFYRLVPTYHRPIDVPEPGSTTRESLHPSVLERYQADDRYRPPRLVEYLDRHHGGRR